MKFLLVLTALVAGEPREYRIPMSPVFVNDVHTCQRVAARIAYEYEASQANFQVQHLRCLRAS